MRVYIGYDALEDRAVDVCRRSLLKVTNGEVQPELLCLSKLVDQGLMSRPMDRRGSKYDMISNAPMATEFAISRFLVPIICQTGFALFVDCDMVFYEDPRNMLREIRTEHAVSVVKHRHTPVEDWKMVNQAQTTYPRKNWSSVMLFNCDHAANRRLSVRDVDQRPGRDLHAFYWLNDMEIGELNPRWNWLVNVQPKPEHVAIAHFTLGGPWLQGWAGAEHDSMWMEAAAS